MDSEETGKTISSVSEILPSNPREPGSNVNTGEGIEGYVSEEQNRLCQYSNSKVNDILLDCNMDETYFDMEQPMEEEIQFPTLHSMQNTSMSVSNDRSQNQIRLSSNLSEAIGEQNLIDHENQFSNSPIQNAPISTSIGDSQNQIQHSSNLSEAIGEQNPIDHENQFSNSPVQNAPISTSIGDSQNQIQHSSNLSEAIGEQNLIDHENQFSNSPIQNAPISTSIGDSQNQIQHSSNLSEAIGEQNPIDHENQFSNSPVQNAPISTSIDDSQNQIQHSSNLSEAIGEQTMEHDEQLSSHKPNYSTSSIDDAVQTNIFALSSISSFSDQETVLSLLGKSGCTKNEIEFFLTEGERFLNKPHILSKKLKISLDQANSALDILKSSLQKKSPRSITKDDMNRIQNCLEENPEFESANDIALFCDIDESVVSNYLDSLPLTSMQKIAITERYNSGCSICDIVKIIDLPIEKVHKYIENTFITFDGKEGKHTYSIIQRYFNETSPFKLRKLIISNDLKLQDQLGCVLRQRNNDEFMQLRRYFQKFSESKFFLDIGMKLTMEDIHVIKQNKHEDLEQLSVRLHKVKTAISNYLDQYKPYKVVDEHNTRLQMSQMKQIVKGFGKYQLMFETYRMIICDSLEKMIRESNLTSKSPRESFRELLPLVFYYLKCSLPLEYLSNMIALSYEGTFTSHDLFHLIFQQSDPVLKGFCIEHYSFSNPVPLIYSILPNPATKNIKTKVCEELWYSLEDFKGLVSFGIGRASWNPVGKSYLLDLIFETDFVKGSPQNSAFHYSSIDIQLTKNLFGEELSGIESTKWAYIDCHGESNSDYIQVICQHLDVALVHIYYLDFIKHRDLVYEDIEKFTRSVTYVYLLIRDCENVELDSRWEDSGRKFIRHLFIPNLTDQNIRIHSVRKGLKEIGYEILHLPINNDRNINSQFMEKVLSDLDCDCLKEIQSDKELIERIPKRIYDVSTSSKRVDFSFLNYYPNFVECMTCFHKAAYETDQNIIDELNSQRSKLYQKYKTVDMGQVVLDFNQIIDRRNSTLLMWKLSKVLTSLLKIIIHDSPQLNTIDEQKHNKYTIEILWREALLSYKYNDNSRNRMHKRNFAQNFSNHVESGEAFELIDGDNLRFFSKDINGLLNELYRKQMLEMEIKTKGLKFSMKQAPIVVSIFGPQSSGKSTLLNYCFGCKFLTSSGRYTKGIYGSLSKLSRPINLTKQFLILDTEGLDAIERGNIRDTSHIHFDRTMVLFCLSVSQVVIINVKGDLGSEMQNLLQICAYSLNKLKVSKVAVPKIFFVLNQQADPDQSKHIDSINILMERLSKESDLMDTEGIRISDLIQVSRENLFILPSAFNSDPINKPNAQLYDSNVIKLSPTISFARKCIDLRLAIIDQLDAMPVGDRQPFKTMSDWMAMSGTVWDTIMKYQDIVKYRNVEELICSRMLNEIVSKLMKTHIYDKKDLFLETTTKLQNEINEIDALENSNILLTEKMLIFDEIFKECQNICLTDFTEKCQSDSRLKKMQHLCEEAKSNLSRLVYVERKIYSDKLKFQIHAVLIEIKLSESMKKFQELIIKNVDNYLKLTVEEQKASFENTWTECFRGDDKREEEMERDENFHNLYSIFRMESKTMEKESFIYELFRSLEFNMNEIILTIESDILTRFQNKRLDLEGSDQLIFALDISAPIRSMTPYPGKSNFEYLKKESLYSIRIETRFFILSEEKFLISSWVPKECHPLVRYCSGHFDTPDIMWEKVNRMKQQLILASQLKNPNKHKMSTWEKLISRICTKAEKFVRKDVNISQGTVKEIINFLCSEIKLVNYEIAYIGAKLTNTAESIILKLLLAIAFKSLWDAKTEKRLESKEKTKIKKQSLLQYFLLKIENRKMVRGTWDRKKMKESDRKLSGNFAREFLEGIKRGLKTAEQPNTENRFKERKDQLSHEGILLTANDTITREINITKEKTVINIDNFVVQYTCDRNQLFRDIFQKNWSLIENELYRLAVRNLEIEFRKQIRDTIILFETLLTSLTEKLAEFGNSEEKAFDSDSNFEIVNIGAYSESTELMLKAKESPFKAMVMYLRMYLDPRVTPDEFSSTFQSIFDVDGNKVKVSDTFALCGKSVISTKVLDESIFKKLKNTKMFNNENIFNISEYVTGFLSELQNYQYHFPEIEFKELVKPTKEEFEKHAIGCPSRCPSCGKLCERELHPNDGKCQIKTGHQICSMGGKVWHNDSEQTAVLFMCDDYKDNTRVILPGQNMDWGQFKEKCGNKWDWTLPIEEKYVTLQRYNREKMVLIWNKFGDGILQYYGNKGTNIKYVPYTSFDDVYKTHFSTKYFICFVIDGTGSMSTDIARARISVGQFISKYKEQGSESKFKVVIYRDHCDSNIIEMFPNTTRFTSDFESVKNFLQGVVPSGGGDYPEAVLDGLATAAKKCEWISKPGIRNVIIHIYDAPPHGDFPNYNSHKSHSNVGNCCCCNRGILCRFDWEIDVWSILQKFQIQYHGINTGGNLPGYETTMKTNLKALCGDFQTVGKEVVNEAILQIFIDYKMD